MGGGGMMGAAVRDALQGAQGGGEGKASVAAGNVWGRWRDKMKHRFTK